MQFTRASTATYTGADGLVKTSKINQLRYDYDPTTLCDKGWLMEEPRTNICLYSEQFDNTSGWGATSLTVYANQYISPDGTQTAESCLETTYVGDHYINSGVYTITAGATITASIFVKSIGRTTLTFDVMNGSWSSGMRGSFDFNANTCILGATNGTGIASSYTITPYINGWYRISITGTVDSTSTSCFMLLHLSSGVGDTSKGYAMWGAQIEVGCFPTSYIPTTTASVARASEFFITKMIDNSNDNSAFFIDYNYIHSATLINNVQVVARTSDTTQGDVIGIQRSSYGASTIFSITGATSNIFKSNDILQSRTIISCSKNKIYLVENGKVLYEGVPKYIPNSMNIVIIGTGTGGGNQASMHIRRFTLWNMQISINKAIDMTIDPSDYQLPAPSLNLTAKDGITPPQVTVTRASTATYTDKNGLIKTALANQLRHDYDFTKMSNSTNYFSYSTDLTNGAWIKASTCTSATGVYAPDGTTPFKLTPTITITSATFGTTASDKNPNGVLSNGNLTWTKTDGYNYNETIRTSMSKTSGKWYAEFIFTATGTNSQAGIVDSTADMTSNANAVGNYASGYGLDSYNGSYYHNNAVAGVSGLGAFTSGDKIMVAVDLDNRLLWFGKNGTWVGNPSAGTGASFTIPASTYYFAASTRYQNDSVTANFGSSAWLYTCPTGFSGMTSGSAGNQENWQTHTSIAGMNYTFSIYARAAGYNYFGMVVSNGETYSGGAVFNLSNGTISSVASGAGLKAKIVSVGNNWYRCIVTQNIPSAGNRFATFLPLPTATSSDSYSGNGTSGVYVWGPQLERTVEAGTYSPTTNTPSTLITDLKDSYRGWLIEESRTNLSIQSQFAAGWSVYLGSTLTPNSILAPDSTITGALIRETGTAASTHVAQQNGISVAAGTYTISGFFKAKERNKVRLYCFNGYGISVSADLSTGQIFSAYAPLATYVGSSITPYPNGWYRISCTATIPGSDTMYPTIYILDSSGNQVYDGDGASGLYAWGVQFEQGAFPTSYIPTTTSAVTRSADVITNTGGFNYNVTEGTLFASGDTLNSYSGDSGFAALCNNTYNNSMDLRCWTINGTQPRSYLVLGASISAVFNFPLASITNNRNMAVGYKSGDSNAALNGVIGTNSNTTALPTAAVTQLNIGNIGSNYGYLNGHLRQLCYWPKRLSNSTLQKITR